MKIIIRSKLPPKNTAPPPRVSMSREEYLRQAWKALVSLARSGRRFTSDAIVKQIAQNQNQRETLGFVVSAAKRRGLVEVLGMVPSTRPESRLRRICELTGTHKAKTAAAAKPPAVKPVR